MNALAIAGDDCRQRARLIKLQPFSTARHDRETRLSAQQRLDSFAVKPPIRLRPRATHRRTLGEVEHLDVNGGRIRRAGHNAVQRINFADQMPLPYPADCWVAGHFANGFNLMSQQQGPRATARRGRRSLTAGMATTHHHHIKGQIRTRHALPISVLFADAEVPEDNIQDFFYPDAAGQAAKGEKCRAQRLGGQFRKGRFLGLSQQRHCFRQCRAMAWPGELIALPGPRQMERGFSKPLAQCSKTRPVSGRDRQRCNAAYMVRRRRQIAFIHQHQ